MKLNVIVDEKGDLVAATTGPVGYPEELSSHMAHVDSEWVASIVPSPGQTVHQVEVSDRLVEITNVVEFHRELTSILR